MTNGVRRPGSRRVWLAAGVVVLAAAAAAAAPTPPALGADASGRWFAALASGAVVALSILPFIIWRAAAPSWVWLAAAGAALVAGTGLFSVGGYAQRACTTTYDGKPTIIGTELTSLGKTYKEANPELSSDDLLFDAAGDAERIWTRPSISRCRAFISSTYFLWIPCLFVCLLAVGQAVPAGRLSPIRWDEPPPEAGAAVPPRYDVFISYRHGGRDMTVAREIAEALEEDGYRVAIDERDFAANASFLHEMERSVRESRFTVAIISRRYLESGNCEEEATICKVLDMGDRKRRLIPFVIEPVSMPAWLYGIVGIDCTKPDPLIDPLDKLKATLGAPAGALQGRRG